MSNLPRGQMREGPAPWLELPTDAVDADVIEFFASAIAKATRTMN
jgi:hypothetical protein